VNICFQHVYEQLMSSGLYDALIADNLLIPHEEVAVEPAAPVVASKVIRPEQLRFVSYPYEWCFGQLKQAALTTLTIQKRALEFGMSLKDCSAYNVQFHGGRPVLIDTLSFETYQEGKPWVPYRQFCQHFLAPLSLMACRDVRLQRLLRVHIDGIPLDLASKLLPARTRLIFSLLSHIHLHAAAQRRYAATVIDRSAKARAMTKTALLGLVDSLESGVRRLHWKPTGTPWVEYDTLHPYTPEGVSQKRTIVDRLIGCIQPESVWDLGANTGMFSRLASTRGIPTVAFDADSGAVEQNYLMCLRERETHLLPLVLDLTNPSPSLGWRSRERMSLQQRAPVDAVLALALVHHLAIANNIPLEELAEFLSHLSRWLVIEFVPKGDRQVGMLLAARDDIFPNYSREGFEAAFIRFFAIRSTEFIPTTERILCLMENRSVPQ
jgi:ribosomal protein L11 methylase PrmA